MWSRSVGRELQDLGQPWAGRAACCPWLLGQRPWVWWTRWPPSPCAKLLPGLGGHAVLSALFCLFPPLSPNLHICCASFLSQSLSDAFALCGAWEETGPGTISCLPACIRAPLGLGVFLRPLPLSSVRGAQLGRGRGAGEGGAEQASVEGTSGILSARD